jgi:hypothetical protein
VFPYEQQSTAIYINYSTVCVSSGKKAKKLGLLVPLFVIVRLSSCNGWSNAENIFMKMGVFYFG